LTTSNIDRFDQLAGKVFALLYESFPMTVSLTAEPFTAIIAVEPAETIEGHQQVFDTDEFFAASITWLAQSGYMAFTAQGIMPATFHQCTLTAKGLEVLKAIPDSLTGRSIGSQLQDAAKAGLLESVKSLTGKALGIGATMGYAAVTTWASS
jgi:hypothetical protein